MVSEEVEEKPSLTQAQTFEQVLCYLRLRNSDLERDTGSNTSKKPVMDSENDKPRLHVWTLGMFSL